MFIYGADFNSRKLRLSRVVRVAKMTTEIYTLRTAEFRCPISRNFRFLTSKIGIPFSDPENTVLLSAGVYDLRPMMRIAVAPDALIKEPQGQQHISRGHVISWSHVMATAAHRGTGDYYAPVLEDWDNYIVNHILHL